VKERMTLRITLSSGQRMVMNIRPYRGGLYGFSSIYKKVMKFSSTHMRVMGLLSNLLTEGYVW
jgi:hypothetical protein